MGCVSHVEAIFGNFLLNKETDLDITLRLTKTIKELVKCGSTCSPLLTSNANANVQLITNHPF